MSQNGTQIITKAVSQVALGNYLWGKELKGGWAHKAGEYTGKWGRGSMEDGHFGS